ncbi:hypothetical protein [Qipengyuania psychrotolerans]|uniref:ATP-grasp fold RimK-type domain-containing protein n=1 Tax=Qipengyuania psychrotolerans TaxID=2867238 RepID=A0ABX8ZDJ8_9SPHN|nr:hypothetical protein [Qipengyuania psychrotolerans]QZD86284.1 hypothetical protein K3166_08430 [Qipengyuania psychrotolerans]
MGLGYAGVDLALTSDDAVQTLEVNAFPGIEIHNLNAESLRTFLKTKYA